MGIKEEGLKKATGSRGKVAEKKVREYLDKVGAAHSDFDFERRYDARTAGGKFPAQPGDFGYFRLLEMGSVNGLIEAKEIAHDHLLPQKNFTKDKIARLRKRYLAGTEVIVLVFHTGLKKWRAPNIAIFFDKPAAPSWNISGYRLYDTVADALKGTQSLAL